MNLRSTAPWLPDKDSNLDKKSQNLLCYRYTIGQNTVPTFQKSEQMSRATATPACPQRPFDAVLPFRSSPFRIPGYNTPDKNMTITDIRTTAPKHQNRCLHITKCKRLPSIIYIYTFRCPFSRPSWLFLPHGFRCISCFPCFVCCGLEPNLNCPPVFRCRKNC